MTKRTTVTTRPPAARHACPHAAAASGPLHTSVMPRRATAIPNAAAACCPHNHRQQYSRLSVNERETCIADTKKQSKHTAANCGLLAALASPANTVTRRRVVTAASTAPPADAALALLLEMELSRRRACLKSRARPSAAAPLSVKSLPTLARFMSAAMSESCSELCVVFYTRPVHFSFQLKRRHVAARRSRSSPLRSFRQRWVHSMVGHERNTATCASAAERHGRRNGGVV